jgi:hypothetical protein
MRFWVEADVGFVSLAMSTPSFLRREFRPDAKADWYRARYRKRLATPKLQRHRLMVIEYIVFRSSNT